MKVYKVKLKNTILEETQFVCAPSYAKVELVIKSSNTTNTKILSIEILGECKVYSAFLRI